MQKQKRLGLWSNPERTTNSSIGAIPAHHTVDSLVLAEV